MRAVTLLLLFLGLSTFSLSAQGALKAESKAGPSEVTVFAAADMEPVLQVLSPYFERRTGIKLKISFGSSATLSQQIVDGAPADIFLSADFTFAERVVAAGKADSTNPTPYARGILVLWERKDGPFQPLSLDVLSRKDLKSVAIANPDHAPYGRAALSAIKKLDVYPNLAPHLVQAESVGQAAQFALSGNAQLALMSQTIAMSGKYKEAGTFVLVPPVTYLEIRQCAVVIQNAKHRSEAHTLLNYLTSDPIQQHLPELGLRPVQ
ncbi:molybdate ABC transporter substrate-binding protein [Terriglobus aquaticus]|uniref:Molybdate ABC transporter substrate-binding protein n=1 Tax=Terriglobus aquaticus TaxID=940139 RepID=A0ABW9KHU9_9BACT|nr:molybdate ABC transporter substrate-binding protein [Terriglobus aquaticus]